MAQKSYTETQRIEIGRWLEDERKKRYSSREAMAADRKIGVSSIQAIENGSKRVSDATWLEYLTALDLTPDDVDAHLLPRQGLLNAGQQHPISVRHRIAFEQLPLDIQALLNFMGRWLASLPHEQRTEKFAEMLDMAGSNHKHLEPNGSEHK